MHIFWLWWLVLKQKKSEKRCHRRVVIDKFSDENQGTNHISPAFQNKHRIGVKMSVAHHCFYDRWQNEPSKKAITMNTFCNRIFQILKNRKGNDDDIPTVVVIRKREQDYISLPFPQSRHYSNPERSWDQLFHPPSLLEFCFTLVRFAKSEMDVEAHKFSRTRCYVHFAMVLLRYLTHTLQFCKEY